MSDIRFNQWLHNSGTGGVSQVDGGHVGIGTTNPLIPVGAGVTAVLNVGVVTANSFYGDGSNLSGVQVGGASSLSFNDNVGLYFGNSQDLKIHHDGNHSYIDDQGTGNLRLRSGTLEITNLASNKTSALFSSGGGQTLNFNNNTKFVTTNTGVVVTGILTASNFITGSSNLHSTGLTVGNNFIHTTGINVGTGATIHVPASNTLTFGTNSNERLRITSTGAINLTSENTIGWQLDAGDDSGSYTVIDNHFPTTNRTLYMNNETTHRSIAFWNKNGSDGYGFGLDNSGNFKVVYGSSERFHITSAGISTLAGYVGINTSSPQYPLHVAGHTTDSSPDGIGVLMGLQHNHALIHLNAESNMGCIIDFSTPNTDRRGGILYYHSNNSVVANRDVMSFHTAASERLRIDSNGKVSIASGAYGGGGTVPELYVKGTSGRQMKIHNSNASTSSLQITNATTGEGEDAGTQLFTQGSTGDFYISNQYASGDISFNTRPSGGSNAKRLTIDSNGVIIHGPFASFAYDNITGLFNVHSGARVNTGGANQFAAAKGGFVDNSRYELENKLITVGGNQQIIQAHNGAQLFINNSRTNWSYYNNLPNYLLGHPATDCINPSNYSVTLRATMTVFLQRTNGWNAVPLTGWELIETDTNIYPGNADSRLYVKTFAAGSYTFDSDSAMYFFIL